MDQARYIATLRDLLSRDPERVRAANRVLYAHVVATGAPAEVQAQTNRDADLALAEAVSI